MIQDSQNLPPKERRFVVVDSGTQKRIPFVIKFDTETGNYEANVSAPNGVDVVVDPYTRVPYVRKGRAVGRLELVPFGKAASFGAAPPKKVEQLVQPMTKDERIAGMEQYRDLYFKVWADFRGNSKRVVGDQWSDFLAQSDFLDSFCLRRTVVPARIIT